MVNTRLLLSSVAFGVGFSISLLVNRDLKPALLTGLISVPASLASVLMINGKQRIEQKPALSALQAQIYQLKSQEAELHQSVLAIANERQRIEVNNNFLKTELNQLYLQIAEQRNYKQQLNQDVANLTEDIQKLQTKFQDLQTQIQNCEKRREELYQSLRSLRTEKQNDQDMRNSMQAELYQLQEQINESQQHKQKLEQDLVVRNVVRLQLEEHLNSLQTQIQPLEAQKAEIQQSLAAIITEKETTEADLHLLQKQVTQQQIIKNELEQKIIALNTQEKQIISIQKVDEKPHDKWKEFGKQLSQTQIQVLKAIVNHDDPNGEIKRIAENNITMPELLIDSINESALNTIGDLIVEPGSEFIPLGILEDYLPQIYKLIHISETN